MFYDYPSIIAGRLSHQPIHTIAGANIYLWKISRRRA
jgi:hypothetical protein